MSNKFDKLVAGARYNREYSATGEPSIKTIVKLAERAERLNAGPRNQYEYVDAQAELIDELLVALSIAMTQSSAKVDLPDREAIADELAVHWWVETLNLGQYKTKLTCDCGHQMALDSHNPQHPGTGAALRLHRADVVLALLRGATK
jgi:hypothetical protein